MQRRKKRRERAWEQSERRMDPVVNRVGRGGKSVWLLLVLSSWWGNMSLTPPLLLCTENITANMRVLKTGRENLIWKMYIMGCCAVWARTLLTVSGLHSWTFPWIHILCTHVAGMQVISVSLLLSACAIKYKHSSPPNYNSDVSLAFTSHRNPASRWQMRKLWSASFLRNI